MAFFESVFAELKAKCASLGGAGTGSAEIRSKESTCPENLKAEYLDESQMIYLRAMVSYVARKTGRSEFGVERELSARFSAVNPHFFPADKYEQALRFLYEQVNSGAK